jgi:FemAB-related protein (PEP-CTERM system-associated)
VFDMRVEEVGRGDGWQAEWNAFVEAQPGAQLGHAAEWAGVLSRAYGVEVLAFAARDGAGAIHGILPLARFRGLMGRRELISLPYLDAAGILASHPEAERALLGAAFAEARAWGAAAVELRTLAPGADAGATEAAAPDAGGQGGEAAAPHRVDLRLELEADEEAQWSAVRAKVRNQTRKATREGLVLGEATGLDALDAFYDPFCRNMRDLGSPVHGRALFAEILHGFGPAAHVITCHGGAESVGGLFAIRFAGTVNVPWASTLRSERKRCPNNLIYWEALRWAVAQGAKTFDFGRSPVGEGTWRFKKGWGAEEVPLDWRRFDGQGRSVALRAAGDDPKLQRLSEMWTRLPVGLTRVVGPPVRRRLSA